MGFPLITKHLAERCFFYAGKYKGESIKQLCSLALALASPRQFQRGGFARSSRTLARPLAHANRMARLSPRQCSLARQFPRQLQRRGVCLRSIAKAQPRSRKRGGRLRAFPGKSSEVRRLPGWASLVSVSGFFSSPPRCSFRPPAFHGQWAPSSRGLVSGAPCPPPFASRRQAPCRLA